MKSGLSMFSSICLFTFIGYEFPVETVGTSGSCGGIFFCIDFQIAYLTQQCGWRRLAMLAFSMFMLKGFYNIFVRTDMESFENVLFISQCRQQYYRDVDVSILFLMAMHNSSPRISGIMMSERISSGQNCFTMVSASLPLLPLLCTL